jgi:hypothetical protein
MNIPALPTDLSECIQPVSPSPEMIQEAIEDSCPEGYIIDDAFICYAHWLLEEPLSTGEDSIFDPVYFIQYTRDKKDQSDSELVLLYSVYGGSFLQTWKVYSFRDGKQIDGDGQKQDEAFEKFFQMRFKQSDPEILKNKIEGQMLGLLFEKRSEQGQEFISGHIDIFPLDLFGDEGQLAGVH